MDLKYLKLIQVIDRLGSLSATARELGYSQPAISQQIKRLEKSLGTPIVARRRRGVALTQAGTILLNRGSEILDTFGLARSEISAVAGLKAGHVSIAAFPSAAASIVPATMARVSELHPGITFALKEAEPPQALELLERGDADIAVTFRYTRDNTSFDDSLVRSPLVKGDVMIALPENHFGLTQERVDLRILADDPWISGCPDCRTHLTQMCLDYGFTPKIAFETDDYVALQKLAAHNLGVALLPQFTLGVIRVPGLHLRTLQERSEQFIDAISTPTLMRVPSTAITIETMKNVAFETATNSGLKVV